MIKEEETPTQVITPEDSPQDMMADDSQGGSFPEPENQEIVSHEDTQASDYPASPESPIEASPKKKQDLINSLMEDKVMLLSIAGAIIFLLVLIRIIRKRRKDKEFDYTNFDIEA